MPSRPGAGYADQKKLYLEFNRAYQTTICPACVCSGQKKNLLAYVIFGIDLAELEPEKHDSTVQSRKLITCKDLTG